METQQPAKSTEKIDAMRSHQEAKQRRHTTFYVILFLVITLLFLTVCFFVFFRVENIKVDGNQIYTDEQIMEYVDFAVGDNLFSFSTSEVESRIRKALPYIGEIHVTRKLPATVQITVSERTKDLALLVGDEIYLLSGDLQVLGRYDNTEIFNNITFLTAGQVSRCVVGEELSFLDARMANDLKELFYYLHAYGIDKKIKSIDLTSRFDITVNYDNRYTVYFADIDDIEIKVKFLIAIVGRLGVNDEGYINLSDCREAAVRLNS